MGEVNFSSMMASHMQYGPIGVSDWVLETTKANKISVKFQISSNQDWELQWSDRSYQTDDPESMYYYVLNSHGSRSEWGLQCLKGRFCLVKVC